MEYKDYYQILGVSKYANEQEIKRAYRNLAREYHPDKNPNDQLAEEKFKQINEAYEVLGNADNRARYNRLGASYNQFRQMGGNQSDFDFSQWFSSGNSNSGFSEFFNAVFGDLGGQQSPFGRRSETISLDLTKQLEVTLLEAFQGTSRKLTHHGEQFTVKIPPGAKTGTKIRLRDKGYSDGARTGDLFLVIKVLPHDTFTRVGNNIEVSLPVPVTTAVLGGKVPVPTLNGSVKLTIPPGTQGGQLFRLQGRGMPHLRQPDQFGDLMVRIHIDVPQQLTDSERELYEKLAIMTAKQRTSNKNIP